MKQCLWTSTWPGLASPMNGVSRGSLKWPCMGITEGHHPVPPQTWLNQNLKGIIKSPVFFKALQGSSLWTSVWEMFGMDGNSWFLGFSAGAHIKNLHHRFQWSLRSLSTLLGCSWHCSVNWVSESGFDPGNLKACWEGGGSLSVNRCLASSAMIRNPGCPGESLGRF